MCKSDMIELGYTEEQLVPVATEEPKKGRKKKEEPIEEIPLDSVPE